MPKPLLQTIWRASSGTKIRARSNGPAFVPLPDSHKPTTMNTVTTSKPLMTRYTGAIACARSSFAASIAGCASWYSLKLFDKHLLIQSLATPQKPDHRLMLHCNILKTWVILKRFLYQVKHIETKFYNF